MQINELDRERPDMSVSKKGSKERRNGGENVTSACWDNEQKGKRCAIFTCTRNY